MKAKGKDKTLVLGYFGYQNNQLDGQTVKTRNIYELLKTYLRIERLSFFDTQTFQSSMSNVLKMFLEVWKADKLIYIPAHNNLRFFFPFIFLISKLRGISVAYVVVGGWLYDFLKDKRLLRYCLKRIELILPQSEDLTQKLETAYNFKNVQTLHNFRITDFSIVSSTGQKSNTVRLVFMARVSKMKGVETIFKLAKILNEKLNNSLSVEIDFYGAIKSDEEDFFREEIERTPLVKYKGVLQPENIHTTLSAYDVLLLPTRYFTEGLPGSVLDAYIAGLPVVVTQWKYAHEFVDNNVSGLITKWNDEDDFVNSVLRLCENTALIESLKLGAREKAQQYSPEAAVSIIKPFFTGKN